jgi:hypothetical protein
VDDRAGQRQALLPAAGELPNRLPLTAVEAAHRDQLVQARPALGARHAVHPGVEAQVVHD